MTEQENSGQTDDQRHDGRTVRTATEARQGEIILGRRGLWIWIASFAAILLLVLAAAF